MQGKKLTYKFIKEQFEKENYKLLSKIYIGANQKLDYVCPMGHEHNITWSNWQMGKRCAYCSKRPPININIVRSEFKKEGYLLLSDKYRNNSQKLEYRCSNGHLHFISYSNWHKGARCPYCAGNIKLNIEFIKAEFGREGYELLTKKYNNSRQKLKFICPNRHRHSITWDSWKRGIRCYYCGLTVKKSIPHIKDEMYKEGYILLTKKYINSKQKLRYICPSGHRYKITWRDWSIGRRCGICNKCRFGENAPNWKGGISCEPYCDVWADNEYKESIKERDDNKCQNPDCWGTSKKLTIHHIDYNKKNCGPGNLITLCNSCNVRANKDRKWHTLWYQTIMYKKYKIDESDYTYSTYYTE